MLSYLASFQPFAAVRTLTWEPKKDLYFGKPFGKMKTFMRSHSCMKSGIWCGQSYFYMPYGLGEIRASLIPLAEQFSFLYFK